MVAQLWAHSVLIGQAPSDLSLCLFSCCIMQRFAGVYKKVVFLHLYAESNEMTKYLDEVKLKVECHPHFAFFRNGKTQLSADYFCVAWSFLYMQPQHLLTRGA